MRGSGLGLVGPFVPPIAIPGRDIPAYAVTTPVGALFAALAVVSLTVVLIGLAHAVDRWTTSGGSRFAGEQAARGRVPARSRR